MFSVEPPLQSVYSNDSSVKPLIVRSTDKDNGLPKETQMAQCTISSGDIKASAQATFSKKLEGFCSTRDMVDLREHLAAIESRFHNELYDLRLMIRSLLPSNYQPLYRDPFLYGHQRGYGNDFPYHREAAAPSPRYYYHNQDHNDVQETNRNEAFQNFPKPELKAPETTTKTTATTTEKLPTTWKPEVRSVMKNNLKSLETGKTRGTVKEPPKVEETTQVPTTTTARPEVEPVPSKNEYTYYWKLENFPRVFNHAKKNEIFSHVFNVKGLFLRIRAALQLLDNENLVLDIEHLANIENVDKMEIEISDGLVFKEIAEEKLFQYSFAIMDQTKPNHDLISPIYWNTETDNFLVPNSVHLLANYVKNDSLLIKLIITF